MAQPLSKLAVIISPSSNTNGATASGTVDCKGYDFITIDLVAGTANTASNKPSALTLTEADAKTGSFVTFSGAVSGTDYTIPNASTSAANTYKFNVNLVGRKRFLRLLVNPRTTQVVCAVGNLLKGDQAPVNTTLSGASMQLDV